MCSSGKTNNIHRATPYPSRALSLGSTNLLDVNRASHEYAGVVITAAAVITMPLLSREKWRIGHALASNTMMTDAKQTDFYMYQAGIVLLGLTAHALFHITWADSVAALGLVPILFRAAVLTFRGEHCCAHH